MILAEEENTEDGEGVVRASKEIWPQAERNQVSQVMKKETTLDGFNFVPLLADFEMYKTFSWRSGETKETLALSVDSLPDKRQYRR